MTEDHYLNRMLEEYQRETDAPDDDDDLCEMESDDWYEDEDFGDDEPLTDAEKRINAI